MIELLQSIGLSIFVYMTLFYIASLVLQDASIVDIAWGMGFVIVSWISLLFVSGVPMLERKYEGNQEFEAYKKRTSVFIPWFTKSS